MKHIEIIPLDRINTSTDTHTHTRHHELSPGLSGAALQEKIRGINGPSPAADRELPLNWGNWRRAPRNADVSVPNSPFLGL